MPRLKMQIKTFILSLSLMPVLFSAHAATQFYKCNVNGSIKYQQVPCQSAETQRPPTVDELNAQRQKRLLQAQPSSATGPANKEPELLAPQKRASFQCDGRTYCSQMTSCAEAKYFLSNCPGVKMDGNHDGVPCEQQWCRPGY